MKRFLIAFAAELSGLAASGLVFLWFFLGVPWLYSHYGRHGDWPVFFLALSVFTVPLLVMCWCAIRWRRKRRKGLRTP
jgi:hypothetical protein